jgi:transposase
MPSTKNISTKFRVYSYGCLNVDPKQAARVQSVLKLAYELKNRIVNSVGEEARYIYYHILHQNVPGYWDAREPYLALFRERKKLNAELRAQKRLNNIDPAIQLRLNDIAVEIKKAKTRLDLVVASTPDFTQIQQKAQFAQYAYYSKSINLLAKHYGPLGKGLSPYTINFYANSAKQVILSNKKLYREKFKGTGIIPSHGFTKKGVTLPLFKMGAIPASKVYSLPRGERKKSTLVKIKVYVTEHKFIELPIVMHRPLPSDAKIHYIKICAFKVRTKIKYKVLFVMGFADQIPSYKPEGIVGVSCNWVRNLGSDPDISNNSITIGTLAGDCGPYVTKFDLGKYLHLRSLQQDRVVKYEEIREYLLSKQDLPPYFPNINDFYYEYNFHKYLVKFLNKNPSFEDSVITNYARNFSHRQYKYEVKHDASEQKIHYYRNIASLLKKNNCNTVVFEKLAKYDSVIALKDTKYQWLRNVLTLYRFGDILTQSGLKVIFVPEGRYSHQCASCGILDKSNLISPEVYRCSTCGYENDAEVNSALNIRSRGIAKIKEEFPYTEDFSEVLVKNRSEPEIISNLMVSKRVKHRYPYKGY